MLPDRQINSLRSRVNGKISRRGLLKALAATVGIIGLGKVLGTPLWGRRTSERARPTSVPEPVAIPSSMSAGSRVVHVHSNDATFWDYGDDYYGDFVNQEVVDAIVDRGVMELTGAPSLANAWQTLVPDYAPGKAIAVKVNFNNSYGTCDKSRTNCPDDWELAIDALIHPINAVVRGLLDAYPDFDASDIWVYDATIGKDPPWSARAIPQRFKDGCRYPGVRFFDQSKLYPFLYFFHRGCNEMAGYTSADPTAAITWHTPPDIPAPMSTQVTDVLVGAAYLINMPIMKRHLGGVTLSFKNHFGSIAYPNLLHDWWSSSGSYYGSTRYNPMVDIYCNPHILGKTVLTVGDALFGDWEDNIGKPSPWRTFGNSASNSLLFSTDPVAIDCVMCDLLNAERGIPAMADDYLVYAAACGLGTYERGDPWGSGYSQIDYLKVEL